jgi:hypothetical protein
MSIEYSSQGCPKCGQKFVIGEPSCSSCGLVFAKWEQKQDGSSLDGSQRMELAWQDVLNRWDEAPVHAKFIEQCNREHNLPFASLKYRRVLEADPHSDVATRMQKRVQQMVISTFVSLNPVAEEKPYTGKALYMFLMIAALMIVMGLNLPRQYLATGAPLVIIGIGAFAAVMYLKRLLR